MIRVTELTRYNSAVTAIQKNNSELEMSQTRLSTGRRILQPHQNVHATVNSIYYRTRLNAIDRFQSNIADGKERIDISHDSIGETTKVLERIRELAVQSSNGTYTKEDRRNMASEVEELLGRLYDISLTKSKGEYIFSGTSVNSTPFRAFYRQDDNMGREIMVGINYEGDANPQNREIENTQYVDVGAPGNYAFWATNMEIVSGTNTANYIAGSNQKIMIDGVTINIMQGDNIETIVERINDSGVNVKASIGALQGEEKVIQIATREPHKIMLQDLEGGTVLQDIGLIRAGLPNNPENNYAVNATVSGKSVFEVAMFLRDAMLQDDSTAIGSTAIGYIDEAIANATSRQSKMSAMAERLDLAYEHFSMQKVATTGALSRNEDVDYGEESVNFSMWEYVHKASLLTSAKLFGPTLMDYLR